MSTIIGWIVWLLLPACIWGLWENRREQRRLIEEIEKKGKVIDLLNRMGRKR